jgi:hypothetical protein
MSFYDNDYSVYVFLGTPESKPIWNWESWSSVAPVISDLINFCRGKAALRSNQYSGDGKLVRFGRMQWSEKSNQKWTYGSPTSVIDESVKFLSTEAWAPSWGQCEKENLSPDLFISISNESLFGTPESELLFNPVIIMAVETSIASANKKLLDELINKLSVITDAKLKVFKERKWGYKELGGFTSAIQDLGSTGLFKPGKRHDRSLDLDTFVEEWRIVP